MQCETTPGMRILSSGSVHLAPQLPFVLVARIGGFDGVGAGIDRQHQIDEMLQLEIEHARRDVDAVAGMESHAIRRNAAQRVIDGLDAQRHEFAAVFDEASGVRL